MCFSPHSLRKGGFPPLESFLGLKKGTLFVYSYKAGKDVFNYIKLRPICSILFS